MTVTIRKGSPREPGAEALLRASHALMAALFPPDENFALDIGELDRPGIVFLVAEGAGGAILGTGALALRDGYGEVKSMFTAPQARGQGVAARILEALEAEARAAGLTALKLETGEALEAAVRLYTRVGFRPSGPFGDYTENRTSRFYEKAI